MNAPITPNPGEATPSSWQRQPRVLFVDDETLITRLGATFLQRLGYAAEVANCPVAALELFRSRPFDVVVTDLTMPKMNGIQLAEAMLGMRPDLPIVLTTAFHQRMEGRDPREFGFRTFLSKPYTLQSLQDALTSALQSIPADQP